MLYTGIGNNIWFPKLSTQKLDLLYSFYFKQKLDIFIFLQTLYVHYKEISWSLYSDQGNDKLFAFVFGISN